MRSSANGHGTFVAGILGALDNEFGVVGVAPEVRLWLVQVIGSIQGGAATLFAFPFSSKAGAGRHLHFWGYHGPARSS